MEIILLKDQTKPILELKDAITDLKNLLEGSNENPEHTQERISNYEDKSVEISLRSKRRKKNEEKRPEPRALMEGRSRGPFPRGL